MALEGVVVPLLTQFGAQQELDAGRTLGLARRLVDSGIERVFLLGSIGEFASLADPERSELLARASEALVARCEVWVGCGAPATAQAVRYAKEAESAGARAVVAVPPYYLHPSEASIARYYRALRAAVEIPLLAYNIPSLVGYPIAPRLVAELAREGVLHGLKDTAGALSSVRGFLERVPEGFPILPGDDALASEAIALGARGAVMGTANLLPRLALALVAAARRGESAKARALQGTVDALVAVIRAGPFPATDKYLAQELVHAEVGYRSPYDALSPEERSRVDAALAPHRAEFAGWIG